MDQPSASKDQPRSFRHRLDRVVGELNVILTALAIGLATLDVTFFVVLRLVDQLGRLPPSAG
jgi:hypothetical protein